jgi:hypothetical protein
LLSERVLVVKDELLHEVRISGASEGDEAVTFEAGIGAA